MVMQLDLTDPEKLNLFYRLAEQTLNGIIITDRMKRIIYVNEAFTASTGYTFQEVEGQNPRFLQSGFHDIKFYRNLWMSIRKKDEWQGEIWNKRKNGEIFVEWQNIMALRDASGEVSHYAAIFTDITERKKVEQKLRQSNSKLKQLSALDGLTGIGNRRYFDQALKRYWQTGKKQHKQVSLLLIDVDHFKEYNDYYGHQKGDECLIRISMLFREILKSRRSATLARYGGEEFAVILADADKDECKSVAQELVDEVRALNIPHERSAVYRKVTVSIGCFTAMPEGDDDSNRLVRSADEALYKAKIGGRNRFEYFSGTVLAAP